MEDYSIKTYTSNVEQSARDKRVEIFNTYPIPDDQILSNLGLFLNSKTLSRILFMNHIYQQILDTHGIIVELGCHWGQLSVLFSALRGIYEPFNRHRKIVAFDTFEGFPHIHPKDGHSDLMTEGKLKLPPAYDDLLRTLMELQEMDNPMSHVKKFEVIKGNAIQTVPQYLTDNPETIVSLAYFDFDIYEPTRFCLEALSSRLTKGSIVAFDELADHDSPGETTALQEVFGLNHIKLRRFPFASRVSYFIYGE